MIPPPLRSTLFPYTTLFRSGHEANHQPEGAPAVGFLLLKQVEGSLVRHALGFIERSTCGRSRTARKSTRLNSGHVSMSYPVFCVKEKSCGSVMNCAAVPYKS